MESDSTGEIGKRVHRLGDRLSRAYFIVTLATFVAVGIPAYLSLTRAVEQQFVGNYADFSISTAAHIFQQHLRTVEGGVYREPLTGKELEAFQVEVQEQVQNGDLRKVKVWRPDGMLLYSTSGIGVGSIREPDHHLAEAIIEGVKTEVEPGQAEVAGEQVTGKVLEIYLPIRDSSGTVANVFELYYSVAPLESAVSSMRLTLFAFLLVLFGVVAGIAQLGARLLVRRNRQLADFGEQLARLAETDGLTRVANHRHFRERLAEEIEASTRYGRRFSLILVDLDFFKRINDTYGHQTGDVVLRETAAAMARSVRSVDLVARYGGEEFAILLPETGESEAVLAAERLRAAVHEIAIAAGSDRVSVTASFGVAEFPSAARDAESLVSAADSALYVSKKGGRDRVCGFSALSEHSLDREDVEHLFHRLRHASAFTMRVLGAAVVGQSGGDHGAMSAVKVAQLAGSVLEMTERERETLTLAASAFDPGSGPGPQRDAEKPDSLTPGEIVAIRNDPRASEKIIAAVADLEHVLDVVRHHSEHFDGSGSPDGLSGEQIPFLSRVLHVVEAYAAITSGRADPGTATPEQAIAELRRNAGGRFDPVIVDRFASAMLGESAEMPAA